MSTHNLCFEQKYEKYQSFLSENFQFLEMKISIYLNRLVFLMNKKNVMGIPPLTWSYAVYICIYQENHHHS